MNGPDGRDDITTTVTSIAECGCYIGPWGGTVPPPRCATHAIAPCDPSPTLPVIPNCDPVAPAPQYLPVTITTYPPLEPPRMHPDDLEALADLVAKKLRDKGGDR